MQPASERTVQNVGRIPEKKACVYDATETTLFLSTDALLKIQFSQKNCPGSGLSLTHVLNCISVKPIIYRLFSILNSDFIHNTFCFYNV